MAKYLNAYDRVLLQIGVKLGQMSQLAGKRLAESMKSFIEQNDRLPNP